MAELDGRCDAESASPFSAPPAYAPSFFLCQINKPILEREREREDAQLSYALQAHRRMQQLTAASPNSIIVRKKISAL